MDDKAFYSGLVRTVHPDGSVWWVSDSRTYVEPAPPDSASVAWRARFDALTKHIEDRDARFKREKAEGTRSRW